MRRSTPAILMTLACLATRPFASAQNYPTKPIRIINPTAAGGASDIMARALAAKLTEVLGQSVIVDNRPGANGIIGTDLVAKAPADGYKLLARTNGRLVMNRAVFDTLPFDRSAGAF